MPLLESTIKIPSDVVAVDFDPTYNYVSATLKNVGLGAVSLANPIGYPVRNNAGVWELIIATEEDETEGIIVGGPPIKALAAAGVTKGKYLILCRGPACVRPGGISAKDTADANITKATVITALAALSPPILAVDEAPEVDFTAP